MKGRFNGPVAAEHRAMTREFVESLDPRDVDDTSEFGCRWLYCDDKPGGVPAARG